MLKFYKYIFMNSCTQIKYIYICDKSKTIYWYWSISKYLIIDHFKIIFWWMLMSDELQKSLVYCLLQSPCFLYLFMTIWLITDEYWCLFFPLLPLDQKTEYNLISLEENIWGHWIFHQTRQLSNYLVALVMCMWVKMSIFHRKEYL